MYWGLVGELSFHLILLFAFDIWLFSFDFAVLIYNFDIINI